MPDADRPVDDGAAPGDPAATLEAWRAQGADRVDPARFRFLEAMSRRAAAREGASRRVLEERLARAMADFAAALASASASASTSTTPATVPRRRAASARPRGPLAELADLLARRALRPAAVTAPEAAEPDAAAAAPARSPRAATPPSAAPVARTTAPSPAALSTGAETLRHVRRTWARLHATRRLDQALAKAPEKAGPLNSHHLVHRTLLALREISPEYLAHFMAHVDALGWLEQAVATGPAAPEARAGTPGGEREKKASRPRSRG